MKTILLVLILLIYPLFSANIFAHSEVDSLKIEIQNEIKPELKLDLIFQLIDLLNRTDNKSTLKYLNTADNILIANSKIAKRALLNKYFANYYANIGKYKKATDYYLSAIELAEKDTNKIVRNKAMNGLAILNMRTKNIQQGIDIFQKLLEYAKEENNDDDINYYSLNLALAHGENGNFDLAEKYLLNIYNSDYDNKFLKAVACNSLSFIYNNSKKYKEALKYSLIAVNQSKHSADLQFRIESLTNYSNSLKGLKQNIKAGKIIKQIIDVSKKNNFIREMNNAVGNLALNYEDLGDYKSALKYYKNFSERRDSLLNEQTTAKISELQIKYETEKKDKEIEEKNASIKHTNLILTFSIAGGILFILISVFIFILYRMKNTAYKELVRKNLEIIKQESELAIKRKEVIGSEKSKYKSSTLSDNKKEELRTKLELAITEEKKFMQQTISLGKLAQDLDVNSKYLSQVIHEIYNSSFADFINRLRVREAAKLLSDKSFSHISIEGISELVGFHTKSSFNIYFKKYMGVTPSFFSKTSMEISK